MQHILKTYIKGRKKNIWQNLYAKINHSIEIKQYLLASILCSALHETFDQQQNNRQINMRAL